MNLRLAAVSVLLVTLACSKPRGAPAPAETAQAAEAAGASACPTGGAGAPVEPGQLIDDFAGGGPLEGRARTSGGLAVREQFQATADARFAPPPGADSACAGGAAHIRGTAAAPGATYTIVVSHGAGAAPGRGYDASKSKGITFRAALGDARAARLLGVELGVLGSSWSYGKELTVGGTTWQQIDVRWSDLQAAPGAPPFSAATLDQIVFRFMPGAAVDLYLDDLAFIR